jgi:hypothetical protein
MQNRSGEKTRAPGFGADSEPPGSRAFFAEGFAGQGRREAAKDIFAGVPAESGNRRTKTEPAGRW